MVEMQGNCPHCGAELEAGAMFCAECGRPVARGGDVPAGQPSAADPAKPQTLERTMIGVQAGSLFGNRSPGTPPGSKAVAPQGAFSPPAAGPRPIGRPPSSFGTSFPFNPREDTRSDRPPPPANKPAANGGGATPDASGKPAHAEAGTSAGARPGEAATDGNDAASAAPAARDAASSAGDASKPNVAVKQAARVNAGEGGASALDEDERSATRARVAPTRQGLPFAGPPAAAAVQAPLEDAKPEAEPAAPAEASEPSQPSAAPAEERPEPPLNPAPGAGAALGAKTLLDFGRDSGNVGAQLAAAVNAAKGSGPSAAQAATPPVVWKPEPAAPAPNAAASAPAQSSMAGSAAEAHAAERPRRPLAKTMLGISPEAAMGLARAAEADPLAPASSAEPPPQAPQPAAPGRAQNPLARTMLGMAGPVAPLPPAGGTANQTIQGMPISPAEPIPPAQPDRGAMNRTMLGMAPLTNASAVPATPAAPPGFGVPVGGRTMLGVPHTDAAPSAAPPFEPRVPPPPRATVIDSKRDTAPPPPKREIKALWPLVAATLAVVIATLVLLLRSPQSSGVDVSAKIISTDTGEALLFEVPSAAEGSKIRFGGQEKPLTAGRASFALAADSLRVGDNLVLAEVVQPNAEIAPVRITLAVYYRIWVDTAPLRAEKSALDVVVTALPGTKVTLDGEELKLDEAGRGVRSYPIDVVNEAKSGVIEHVVRYRVQPPAGDTVVDELRTRIPVAMMQIDRPGREVITDKESIEIAGAAGKDTQIRLDKTAIPVKDGRFLYRFMLPEPGEYKPKLVASATGRAPLGVTLSIRRVRDLNQAAAQFSPVPDLNYAKLAPNPAIYKGQKIALEGRVYAVDPRGADSVIQMFARPCPSSRRCPLWVSNPQATDVNVDAWIKVLGVVQGEQQFRSEKNEIVTVPKVEAQFILPASP